MIDNSSTSLEDIRASIDEVDARIIYLLKERQDLVRCAGLLKGSSSDVRAPKRVEQVIAKAKERAEREGMSVEVVESVYRAMIDAYVNLEMREYRLRN